MKGETRSLDFFVGKTKGGDNFQRRGNQPNTRLRERRKGNIKKELSQSETQTKNEIIFVSTTLSISYQHVAKNCNVFIMLITAYVSI